MMKFNSGKIMELLHFQPSKKHRVYHFAIPTVIPVISNGEHCYFYSSLTNEEYEQLKRGKNLKLRCSLCREDVLNRKKIHARKKRRMKK